MLKVVINTGINPGVNGILMLYTNRFNGFS